MANSTVFSKLIDEYGNAESDDERADTDPKATVSRKGSRRKDSKAGAAEDSSDDVDDLKKQDGEGGLMQSEERATGAVTWPIYKSYMQYAGGVFWGPLIFALLTLTQAAAGACSLSRYMDFP